MSMTERCYINIDKVMDYLKDQETILVKYPRILHGKTLLGGIFLRFPEHPSFTKLEYRLGFFEDIENNITIGLSYTGRLNLREDDIYVFKYPVNIRHLIFDRWILSYGSIRKYERKLSPKLEKYLENYFYTKFILHRFPVFKELKISGKKYVIPANRVLSIVKDPEKPGEIISLGVVTGRIYYRRKIGRMYDRFLGLEPIEENDIEASYVYISNDRRPRISRCYIKAYSIVESNLANGVYLLANIYSKSGSSGKSFIMILDKLELDDDDLAFFLGGSTLMYMYYYLYVLTGNIAVKKKLLIQYSTPVFESLYNSFSAKGTINDEKARSLLYDIIDRIDGTIFIRTREKISLYPSKTLFRQKSSVNDKLLSIIIRQKTRHGKLTPSNIGYGEYVFINELVRNRCKIIM